MQFAKIYKIDYSNRFTFTIISIVVWKKSNDDLFIYLNVISIEEILPYYIKLLYSFRSLENNKIRNNITNI